MNPNELEEARKKIQETLVGHLIAINSARLDKEDRNAIMDFPLGLLLSKDSGFIVNGIESIINDELREKGFGLKRYSVYALAAGDFSFDGFKKLQDVTETIVGDDPTITDIITVKNAIDALISCCIEKVRPAA